MCVLEVVENMAYIYKITNQINGKVYIGKTHKNINKRWNEHIRDSKKESRKNRPLYKAINKYGEENFKIELIEETYNPEKREIFWIKHFKSFHYGYNATKGGDGRPYIDYNVVIQTYNKILNKKETAKCLDLDHRTVENIINENRDKIFVAKNTPNSKSVGQFDVNDNFIAWFESAGEAGRKLIDMGLSASNSNTIGNRIRECANGQKRCAYGYIWKFMSYADYCSYKR